jgi:subtilisin family serine protease
VLARATRLLIIVAILALASTLARSMSGPAVAVAEGGPGLPAYRELVQDAARQSWRQISTDALRGQITALVQVDMLPLGLVGMNWSHAQRASYSAKIAAAQDTLAASLKALGGQEIARFSHASTGLVVRVDAGQTGRILGLSAVAAVMYVGDYAVDQASAAQTLSLAQLNDLIGGAEARRLGNDGSGVDIALVDTGVDYTHRKLGGSGTQADYNRAACGSASLQPGETGCDPQLDPPADLFPNAKVRGGYDYVGDTWPNPDPRCGMSNGKPRVCAYPDANPIDTAGHGTHVADIAAGLPLAADGSDGGVAPGANLWAFKACNSNSGSCEGTALLRAIDAALDLDGSDRDVCNPDTDPACLNYDPADIINLSISYRYGQPEDVVTLFANIASYYGSLVVAAAGNDGDKPYIVGSPGTAAAALAVAESAQPGPSTFVLRAARQSLDALHQDWSGHVGAAAQLPLRSGNGAGANVDGCAGLAASSGALLVNRGGCGVDTKVSNAVAAGAALLLIADTARADSPPSLPGSATSLPVYSITLAEGDRLRAALQAGSLDLTLAVAANTPSGEIVAASSSRGPRIADGAIKPDMAAPGAIISAQLGGGSAVSAFGGSSGAAPVVAGAAALIIQELEKRHLIDSNPGLGDAPNTQLSLAPLVKTVLMNGASGSLQTSTGAAAPVTLQGAGRIDVMRAYKSRTMAIDATDMIALLGSDASLAGCSVRPFIDLINYLFYKTPLPCAVDYPFGNALMRSWNAMAGSISFGYRPAAGYQEIQRQLVVYNYSLSARTYKLSSALRSDEDAGRGVSIGLSASTLTLAAKSAAVITVTATISPRNLPDWSLNGGALGNRGSSVCDSADPATDCPSLTFFEVDGSIFVDGGSNNQLHVPWQILPRKAADVSLSGVDTGALTLHNPSSFKAGAVEPFALVDVSPNKCDTSDGTCTDVDYSPGATPGSDRSPVDIHYVGVRSYVSSGINASLGLTPAAGAPADEVVEFAITVYDKPYRASPNTPVQFEVHIDSDRDGVTDYVAFSSDYGDGSDGRSAVFVRDVNPADGTRPTQPYMFTVADFNSQNWVLPVPAAALDLRSDRPFSFVVKAYDAYFRGSNNGLWDCSPGPLASCGASVHTIQTGALRYTPAESAFSVPAGGTHILRYNSAPGNAARSPAQIGLLLLYRDALVGQESAGVTIP